MSNNVLKVSKQQSQPNSSGHQNMNPFSNSILQLQRNISLDFPKEKELTTHAKDSHPQTTSSQQNIKKLAVLLDPHKELNNCVNSSYTSPKSFVGNSTKSTNLKASASSLENSNLNLISPKDLVRLAMSKNKSKALVKKVPVQSSTSVPRNARKSVCLRSGESRSKKRDRSNSKAACTTLCDEPSILSKTTMPVHQDKNSKLKRMKLIYNDNSQSDLAARLARSSIYTPQEASGRFWQGTLSPNRSNSGLLWPGSPNPNISVASATNAKSKLFANQIGLGISGKENEDSKTEESHRKRGSVGHIGALLKDSQTLKKQTKKSEKKTVQPRQTVSTENLKASSLLYSKLLSQNAAHQEAIERAKSPTVQLLDEIDENQDVLEISEYIKEKETKPREEFIADLKNWVNDIVKPQDEIPEIVPKKAAVAEKVKEVQEGLLSKLRDALENDEFVRREDYERLYTEKESIEEELDATKEENAQLRAILWKIQEEKEAKENELTEKEKLSPLHDSQDYEATIHALQELVARQNMELEDLRKRENIVQGVLQTIWKAGSQIGGFPSNNMMNETPQSHHQQKGFETELNSYVGENGNYVSSIKPESYTGQQEMAASEATSRNPLALSEMEDSEFETFNIQPLLTMAKSPHVPMNPIQKVQTNSNQSTTINAEVSALPVAYQNYFPTKSQEKLKLDLTGLGGNGSRPKSNMFSTQSSIPNINKPVMTDTAPPMGFHEEFMSKLEEFSLSWRQDALMNQKF